MNIHKDIQSDDSDASNRKNKKNLWKISQESFAHCTFEVA